jgi:cell division protease FtsH
VDLGDLAAETPGFAGADLANLINEAALLAAHARKAAIDRQDLETALDRIVLGAERPLLVSERERRIFAYHETGHALVAHLTPGADPVMKVSVVPRGQSMGATVQAPSEEHFAYTSSELRDRLAILLAGRAAEELVFGQATTGAENDLKEATTLARRMVGRWGMSETVGTVFLGLDDEHPFLGRGMMPQQQLGDALLDRAEQAVQELLDEARTKARSTLETHREAMDRVAAALVREETLDRERVAALIEMPADQREAPAAVARSAAIDLSFVPGTGPGEP